MVIYEEGHCSLECITPYAYSMFPVSIMLSQSAHQAWYQEENDSGCSVSAVIRLKETLQRA